MKKKGAETAADRDLLIFIIKPGSQFNAISNADSFTWKRTSKS
jgi:hypothetical protein